LKFFVVDTSVAVKWFSREDGAESALAVRKAAFEGRCRLEAPDLLLYELANALRFNPNFDGRDVKLAVRSVEDMGIVLHAPQGGLLSRAIDLAYRYRITAYDGCFLALSVILGTPLVTADAKIIERAGNDQALVNLADLDL